MVPVHVYRKTLGQHAEENGNHVSDVEDEECGQRVTNYSSLVA